VKFPLGASSILRRGAQAELLAGPVALLVNEQPRVRAVNETAARIWELLDGERSIATISALLAEELDAPAEQIERDVTGFLQQLLDSRLVETR